MAMMDFDRPLYRRQDPKSFGVDIHKMYYVAFFNNGILDTRPIKIKDIFTVGEKNIRTEINWEYYFEVEKTITEKLTDKRLWKRLLGLNNDIIQEKITEAYIIKSQDDEDMIDFDVVGETPTIAKLKLCMVANITPRPSQDKVTTINEAMDIFRETDPDLIIKAMDWKFSEQFGDITNHARHFTSLEYDIRNR